jgi:hypothetical protein
LLNHRHDVAAFFCPRAETSRLFNHPAEDEKEKRWRENVNGTTNYSKLINRRNNNKKSVIQMMVKLLQLIIKQQKKGLLANKCLDKFDLCLKEKNNDLS